MNKKPVRESWSDSDGTRARVLLEGGPEYSPSVIAPIVERHGFEVRTCEGPTHDHGCDLLDNGTCALVDGADVVVNMLSTSLDGPMVLDAVTGLRRPPGVVATDSIATDRSAAGPPTIGAGGEASPVFVFSAEGFCSAALARTGSLATLISKGSMGWLEPSPFWGAVS